MGLVSWLVSGVAAFAVARIVPPCRTSRWRGELIAALLCAVAAGAMATALDFGGWNEVSWRAALLALLAALAAAGALRTLRLSAAA
jgi:hypothetical protein